MRSSLVEVSDIAIENALELLLAEDQQVVQAFLSDAPQIAFADGIGLWHVNRRLEKFDATGHRHSPETGTKLAVVITDQILGDLPIGGGFTELLRHPGIGRRACHAYVDHLTRLEFDDEEGKERSKEEIGDL